MFLYYSDRSQKNGSQVNFNQYLKVALEGDFINENFVKKKIGGHFLEIYIDYIDQYFEDKRYIYYYSGYLSGIENSAEELSKNLFFKDNSLCFKKEIGGIYTAIIIDKQLERAISWSSSDTPSILYYDDSGNIATNPLFIYMLDPDNYNINNEFLLKNMSSGYMLENLTLFEGIKSLDNNILIIVNENIGFGSIIPTYQFKKNENINDTIFLFSEVMKESLKPLENILNNKKQVELRVSGGKDSRTLLAAFYQSQQKFTPVIYGQGVDDESKVANKLIQQLGKELLVTHPIFPSDFRGILKNIDLMLLKMGGFIHVEARQAAYIYPKLTNCRNPIVLGHAHLQRGGFARTMDNKKEFIDERVVSYFVNRFVKSDVNEINKKIIQAYKNTLLNISNLDVLYLVNKKYRVRKYLQSHYLYQMAQGIPFYPLIDSKVINFLDQVPMFHKISEIMVFKYIENTIPSFSKIPLAGKRWRCDANDIDGYDERSPDIVNNYSSPFKSKDLLSNKINELSLNLDIYNMLISTIKSDSNYAELYSLLSKEGQDLFDDPIKTYSLSGTEKKIAMDFIWRCLILLRSLSLEWMKLL